MLLNTWLLAQILIGLEASLMHKTVLMAEIPDAPGSGKFKKYLWPLCNVRKQLLK